MDRCSEEMSLSLLSMVLLWLSTLLCSAKETTMLTLDSGSVCLSREPATVHWASKDKSVVVVGRGAKDRVYFHDCSVVIGAATVDPSILQLQFDAFHIRDCGVTVQVNQSQRSDFRTGTSVLAMMGCRHGTIKMLHSLQKHYIKIAVHRDRMQLQQYNFRINITVIDKLPETGPETHVVIIVGVAVLVVVGASLWLLVKYLLHRTQRWQEHCAERNMERAIRLYNSQESPPESDYMYTALPPQDFESTQLTALPHRNGHCHPSKSAGGRGGRHRGDITFVHADGHIETFRMRSSSPQERRSGSADHARADHSRADHAPTGGSSHRGGGAVPHGRDRDIGPTPHGPAPHRSAGVAPAGTEHRDAESVAGDTGPGEDILGECPPSYEEALHMPTPQDPRCPLYVNLDSKRDDNHTT